MKNLDDQIRDAIQAEEDELSEEDQDFQAHFESLKTMFRGKTKWFSVFHLCTMGVLITMIVVSAIQFFHVESTRAMIAWGIGCGTFIILEAITELYFMLEWNKYVIRWEVKRLELQVASLAGEMRDSAG